MPISFKEVNDAEDGVDPDTVVVSDEPVALRDAKHLYQKVKGTSNVYRVAAIAESCAVAVRIYGGKVSVRVESRGPDVDAAVFAAAALAGFEVKEGHASVHVALGDPPHCTADNVIGSLLMALKQPFWTKMPIVEKLL